MKDKTLKEISDKLNAMIESKCFETENPPQLPEVEIRPEDISFQLAQDTKGLETDTAKLLVSIENPELELTPDQKKEKELLKQRQEKLKLETTERALAGIKNTSQERASVVKSGQKKLMAVIREKTRDGEMLVDFLINVIHGLDPITGKKATIPHKLQDKLSAINILERRGWGNPVQEVFVEGEIKHQVSFLDLLRLRGEVDNSEAIDVTPEEPKQIEEKKEE